MNLFYLVALSLSTLFSLPLQNVKTIAGIVKITPNHKKMTYEQLPFTEKNREQIIDLITTLGSNSYWDLWVNQKERLEKIGEDIKHLHPYKFIGCIFSTQGQLLQSMQTNMKEIMNSSLTRARFFDNGLAPSLTNEAIKGTLNKYLDDFAREVRVPKEKLKSFVERRDWLGMIWFLIEYRY